MIFLHEETGLQINVLKKQEFTEYQTSDGKRGRVTNEVWYVTEAGQQCIVGETTKTLLSKSSNLIVLSVFIYSGNKRVELINTNVGGW